MDKPNYEFEYSNPYEVYTFTSEGKNGRIKKMVKFQLIQGNLFNLGFGDCRGDDDDFDDKVVSDNGDMEVVLSFEKNVNYEAFLIQNRFNFIES